MLGLGASVFRAVGNTACTQARGLGMDTMNRSRCTTRPAWSKLGTPASTTHARTPRARLLLRPSSATRRCLSATSTISQSIFQRSNRTFPTCSGCRGLTGKVQVSVASSWFLFLRVVHVGGFSTCATVCDVVICQE